MLALQQVAITRAGQRLFEPLSVQVAAGELLVLMGPSGVGKSALLAWLCGTLPEGLRGSGRVSIDGREVGNRPTAERGIGILFQDDLLFPHMTVLDNLLFALPAGAAAARVAQADAALASADLAGFGVRRPHTLSGGQRARVSLLRALLAAPRALLLDEPFSRLDTALRARFRAFVFERLAAQRIPAILVTHDLADVPAGARVLSIGAPAEADGA